MYQDHILQSTFLPFICADNVPKILGETSPWAHAMEARTSPKFPTPYPWVEGGDWRMSTSTSLHDSIQVD